MLSFLSPLFLIGAAAATVPIVLHFLNREPDASVKFSAVKLLRRAPVEHTRKRRLRQLLLLVLRVATLALLAVAFARPFFATGAAVAASGVTIVALDTSYSMSAPGRFDRAKQLAKAAIDRAPAGDLVGVVTFSDQAEIDVKPTADRVLASTAITEAAAGFGATRYRAALSAASQNLGGRKGAIVVVTDLQENGWDAGDRASVPDNARIEVADVGEAPSGLSVTAIHPLSDRLVATVRNSGSRPRDARVRLAIDNRPAGEAAISLGARQSAEATFAGAPRGLAAAVSVDDPDGIQADNVRYAVLNGTTRPTLLVVTGGGELGREAFYLQHAMTAGIPSDAGYRVTSISGTQLSAPDAAALASHAAVILLSTRGLERRGREALASYARNGGGVLVAVGPDVDGDVVADVLGSASTLHVAMAGVRPGPRVLAPADVRHPIFQAFAANPAVFGLVTFDTVARIGGSACQTLARFTTGDAALLECPAGEGRALVLASDLGNRWNDFPLHATFVPFVHEVTRYLASARAHASEYLVADVPPGAPRVPGVVTLTDAPNAGSPGRRVAINVDPREADPARLSVDEFLSAVTRLKDIDVSQARVEARQQEDEQHLWRYLLAMMTIVLAVEGIIAARTT
jgi:Aerotolerance regulator N-terminal/von Willebrand factor type A domain